MPGSRVLLVDHDVDALAQLAAKLRERGIRVSLANGPQMACERARSGGYDVVLAARAVAEPTDGAIGVIDALSVELAHVPPLLVLHDVGEESDLSNDRRVARSDIDRIVLAIEQLTKPSERDRRLSFAPSAFSIESAPLGDLLIVLGTERRSGTLTVTTSKGSGEIRLVDGEIADAVYVRIEGKKAIARMLGERDGTATFAPGAPAIMRRMHEETRPLVAEARQLVAQAATLRAQAGDLTSGTLLAMDPVAAVTSSDAPLSPLTDVDQHILTRLRVPAMLDDLLDELPHVDAAILESLLGLDARGRIKRLGHVSLRVQLCGPDQLHLLRASAARARRVGFAGPARLVFAATPTRLAIFGHTVLSLADAFAPPEAAPSGPVPYVVARIRLGDGVELDITALPLVPAYAPLWPMALAGAAVLVRLDEAAVQSLEEACASVAVPILDARAVFGALEESSAVQVASLIRTALETDGPGAA